MTLVWRRYGSSTASVAREQRRSGLRIKLGGKIITRTLHKQFVYKWLWRSAFIYIFPQRRRVSGLCCSKCELSVITAQTWHDVSWETVRRAVSRTTSWRGNRTGQETHSYWGVNYQDVALWRLLLNNPENKCVVCSLLLFQMHLVILGFSFKTRLCVFLALHSANRQKHQSPSWSKQTELQSELMQTLVID